MIEEPNNFVFKLRGIDDKKSYKVKIERPLIPKVNNSPLEIGASSRISS